MKTKLLNLICLTFLVLICTGCLHLFGESFYARDSIVNATSKSWTATAGFTSGECDNFVLGPGAALGFQRTGRGEPMPVLTNIMVQSWSTPVINYSLSNDEISKLRSAYVRLVLYEEGIASMSPSIGKALRNANRKRPLSSEEYRRIISDTKSEAFRWTREVLTK